MKSNADAIVKALECCHLKSEDCISCPFVLMGENCANLEQSAVSLIKELIEENEGWEEITEGYRTMLENCHKEKEKLIVERDLHRLSVADTVRKMQLKLTDRSEFALRADSDGGMYYVDHAAWVEEVATELLEGKNDV